MLIWCCFNMNLCLFIQLYKRFSPSIFFFSNAKCLFLLNGTVLIVYLINFQPRGSANTVESTVATSAATWTRTWMLRRNENTLLSWECCEYAFKVSRPRKLNLLELGLQVIVFLNINSKLNCCYMKTFLLGKCSNVEPKLFLSAKNASLHIVKESN